MQVGTTKDQGLYNKSSAAVHPGALAAGTLPQYNTIRYYIYAGHLHLRLHNPCVLFIFLLLLFVITFM